MEKRFVPLGLCPKCRREVEVRADPDAAAMTEEEELLIEIDPSEVLLKEHPLPRSSEICKGSNKHPLSIRMAEE